MQYCSTGEAALRWGISQRRVVVLCAEGRIEGAERFGKVWAIPKEATKPIDARIRTGRYVGIPRKRNNSKAAR